MLTPATLLAFVAAVLLMQVTPGPDMMLIVGRGVGQGWAVALRTVLGMTLLAGAVLGVASLLLSAPLALMLLRWAGVAYLLWLGAGLLLRSGRRHLRRSGPAASTGGAVAAETRTSDWAAVRE